MLKILSSDSVEYYGINERKEFRINHLIFKVTTTYQSSIAFVNINLIEFDPLSFQGPPSECTLEFILTNVTNQSALVIKSKETQTPQLTINSNGEIIIAEQPIHRPEINKPYTLWDQFEERVL